jgi:hypothetical protein
MAELSHIDQELGWICPVVVLHIKLPHHVDTVLGNILSLLTMPVEKRYES